MQSANDKLNIINASFASQSLGFYPFISNNRLTILKKGFYKKLKSNYRGVSVVTDKITGNKKVILMGYYYIPDNMVIVPKNETFIISDNMKKLLNDLLKNGYKEQNGFPKLNVFEFDKDSEEYKLAFERKIEYNKNNLQ